MTAIQTQNLLILCLMLAVLQRRAGRSLRAWRAAAAPLRPRVTLFVTLVARSSESTVTASEERYVIRSRAKAARITWVPLRSPSSIATSGNTSWMLNTNGTRRTRAAAA